MHWSKLYARQLRDTEIIPSSQTSAARTKYPAISEAVDPHHKHGRKPKSIHVCLVIFSFRWQQYHHYHSPKFKICYITRNEETGIHTDLHQLLQDCTAWSRWYRNWRPQASRPKPFVFMATFSYIVYKEIYEKLEFTGRARGFEPQSALSHVRITTGELRIRTNWKSKLAEDHILHLMGKLD